MAEWLEVPLGVETLGAQGTLYLTGDPTSHIKFDAAFAKLLWPLV